MADEPKPTEPTVAELKSQIDVLRSKLAGMVPSAEKDDLAKQLAEARAELAALKAPPPTHEKTGFFPKLF